MKRAFKLIFKTLLFLILFIVCYFLLAITLSWISVDKEQVQNADIPIFILSNGVHTDIVVPAKHEVFNWESFIRRNDIQSKDTTLEFVSFGWGDKGFYLETPTWADLKFTTAFKAAFGLSTSAMHVTYRRRLKESNHCKQLHITTEQYAKLVNYIKQSFSINQDKTAVLIPTNAVYGANDAFYEANGSYSLFKTCNTWTNASLKTCGQKACLWTPFENGIFYQHK